MAKHDNAMQHVISIHALGKSETRIVQHFLCCLLLLACRAPQRLCYNRGCELDAKPPVGAPETKTCSESVPFFSNTLIFNSVESANQLLIILEFRNGEAKLIL